MVKAIYNTNNVKYPKHNLILAVREGFEPSHCDSVKNK